MVLLGRSQASKDVEIIVVRYEAWRRFPRAQAELLACDFFTVGTLFRGQRGFSTCDSPASWRKRADPSPGTEVEFSGRGRGQRGPQHPVQGPPDRGVWPWWMLRERLISGLAARFGSRHRGRSR